MEIVTIKIPDQINTKTFDVRIYLAAKLYEDAESSKQKVVSHKTINREDS